MDRKSDVRDSNLEYIEARGECGQPVGLAELLLDRKVSKLDFEEKLETSR